jgi:hypothetical protein
MPLKKNIPIQGILITLFVGLGMLFSGCDELNIDDGSADGMADTLNTRDSAAIRAILDANGMQSKNVRDVIELEDGMAIKLILDSMTLTRFTITKAFDSCVNYFELSIQNGSLETLAVADTVHIPMTLMIKRTNLPRISDDISRLKGRMSVYLSDNQLSDISPAIMQCDVRDMDVNKNELCTLPDSLKNWVNSKSMGASWQNTQKCGQ